MTVSTRASHWEIWCISVLSCAALLFNALPTIYTALYPLPGETYVVYFPYQIDQPVYLSEMNQGHEGSWLIYDRFTSEAHSPIPFHLFYTSLGHLAREIHISVEALFFLSRFFFGALLIAASIYCIRTLVSSAWVRICAYPFLFFAGGLGVFFPFSPNNWMIDAMPMARFSTFPHFALGHALLIATLTLFFLYWRDGQVWRMVGASICTAILNIVMPYHSIFVYVFSGVLLCGSKNPQKVFWHLALFLLVSVPTMLFTAYLALQDHPFSTTQLATALPLFPPLMIFSGYALSLIFFCIGLPSILRNKDGRFVFAWLAVALLLMYFTPLEQRRRLFETGTFLPLAIGAGYGMHTAARALFQWYRKRQTWVSGYVCALAATAACLAFIGGNYSTWEQFISYHRYRGPAFLRPFLPTENIRAMRWLRDNTEADSIILSSYPNGNSIPAVANRTVYIGHGYATLRMREKYEEVERFFGGMMTEEERTKFLLKEGIDYIFFSSLEKRDTTPLLESHPFLSRVYREGDVSIYRIKQSK